VLEDMLGLSPRVPRFVKEFGKLGEAIQNSVKDYASEVKNRKFPSREHVYGMKKSKTGTIRKTGSDK